jgi:hypothetical protein
VPVVRQGGVEVAAEDALGRLRGVPVADEMNRDHGPIVCA